MNDSSINKALEIMNERFSSDSLISIATICNGIPYVRNVNSYYEAGSFYIITHNLSNKMKQININSTVAICGEWFTGHGTGINLGHVCSDNNVNIAKKLRKVFESWYSNGHIDESDPNTCILCINLSDAVLFSKGTRYDIYFEKRNKQIYLRSGS